MTTTTDVNSMLFHSSSSRMNDETKNSFILNQSLDRMDIDDNTQDLITPVSNTMNGHISSSHAIENGISDEDDESKKDDVFHQG
jgi:hypothetical protein